MKGTEERRSQIQITSTKGKNEERLVESQFKCNQNPNNA